MNDKIKEKLKNKDFLKKIIGLETKEEAEEAFSEEGLEISEKEVEEIGEYINACIDKLSKMPKDDLEKISGGGITEDTFNVATDFLHNKWGLNYGTATDVVMAGVLAVTAGVAVGTWEGGKLVLKKANTWWKNRKGAGGKS
ncbi:MAG: hypothetical protein LBR79_05360 [Oscillospiraceae bacterium]|jgi:hypothetical protein|nr:hypothetical protein [Oscillospiraceae bacterium]